MQADAGENREQVPGGVPPDAPADATASGEGGFVSIFRVNPAEWWAAESLDQALNAAAAYHGLPRHEIVDELAPPYELSPAEMMEFLITIGDHSVPFFTELYRRKANGWKFPCLFGQASDD